MAQANDGGTCPERESISAARQEASELAKVSLSGGPPVASIPGYTIVREIGRGGMGVIYEAEQNDPRRTVALKVMRSAGAVDEHRLTLFRQEVETLARLSYPNIAAIYEAGSTDDGRHFFAMELVRGASLIEYVRLKQLGMREQLQLFRRICDAVHHAHQRGVIHRDLKPSNIIVDTEGNPKVLDFGLARIVDADEAMRGTFVETGKIMGTLPYMSPEQTRGGPNQVDTRTDVYALGVILYELLTDQLPYDLGTAGRGEVRRIICEELPRKPSTISRALRGDLETIVLKTLEKKPSDRYQSAAALSEDIDRYLTNRPILSHPPSAAYQFHKFVARHKVLSVYVGTLTVLAIGFGIGMSHLSAQTHERERYELQRQRAVEKWRRERLSEHKNALLAAKSELAVRLEALAGSLMRQRDFAAAELILSECLNIRRHIPDEAQRLTPYTQSLLGECLTALGRYEQAEVLLLESHSVISQNHGEQHEQALESANRLVDLYQAWGKPRQAAEWRTRLSATQPTSQPPPANELDPALPEG